LLRERGQIPGLGEDGVVQGTDPGGDAEDRAGDAEDRAGVAVGRRSVVEGRNVSGL